MVQSFLFYTIILLFANPLAWVWMHLISPLRRKRIQPEQLSRWLRRLLLFGCFLPILIMAGSLFLAQFFHPIYNDVAKSNPAGEVFLVTFIIGFLLIPAAAELCYFFSARSVWLHVLFVVYILALFVPLLLIALPVNLAT